MPAWLRHVLFGLAVIVLQWLFFKRVALWGAVPDAVLLYVVWTGLRYGRLAGAVSGGAFGLLCDLFVYGTGGLHMFTKTLIGFLAGLIPLGGRDLSFVSPGQAFVGGLAAGLVHNGILVILVALRSGASNTFMIGALWIGGAFYTALVALIASLFATR
jgi:rod shape-determining protein MreD